MKQLVLLCALVVSLTFPILGFTQSSGGVTPQQQQLDALKGTYEIKMAGRQPGVLPSNLAEIIEKNRKENEITTLKLSESITLVIYPKNQVQTNK